MTLSDDISGASATPSAERGPSVSIPNLRCPLCLGKVRLTTYAGEPEAFCEECPTRWDRCGDGFDVGRLAANDHFALDDERTIEP